MSFFVCRFELKSQVKKEKEKKEKGKSLQLRKSIKGEKEKVLRFDHKKGKKEKSIQLFDFGQRQRIFWL